jgi:signal transduction histidine kinase
MKHHLFVENKYYNWYVNIILNARKRNVEDKLILIEFKNNILQIKDSGKGIDKKIISKILEPYFTTKHQAFGIGLGLYIVNEFFVSL